MQQQYWYRAGFATILTLLTMLGLLLLFAIVLIRSELSELFSQPFILVCLSFLLPLSLMIVLILKSRYMVKLDRTFELDDEDRLKPLEISRLTHSFPVEPEMSANNKRMLKPILKTQKKMRKPQ